jgi:cytochrome c oxidase assembly protein subunit 15
VRRQDRHDRQPCREDVVMRLGTSVTDTSAQPRTGRFRHSRRAAGCVYAQAIAPSTYRRITLVTLALLVFIMVTGAAVRLTGSGLGCSTWPRCESDSFTPHGANGQHGWIEEANRLVTASVGLFAVVVAVGARRRRPRRDDLVRWSMGLPAWIFANGLVGALVVWLDLSPVSVIGHFLLSLGALWNGVVLHRKACEDDDAVAALADGTPRRALVVPELRRGFDLLMVAAAVALVTGTVVTGSGPHAGDEKATRLPFGIEAAARVHGIAVLVFLGVTLLLLAKASAGDADPAVLRRLRWLIGVIVAQGAVGYTQYFTGVPALLVGVHVLGAALVWIAVLTVRLGLTEPQGFDRRESRATMGGDADRRLSAA